VIVCADEAEMIAEADRIASEHVQVMTRDPDVFLTACGTTALYFSARAPTSPTATR